MKFFYVIEKENLTGLGSKPKVDKLQCKSRVGTEGMQGVYSDGECFILNWRADDGRGHFTDVLEDEQYFKGKKECRRSTVDEQGGLWGDDFA